MKLIKCKLLSFNEHSNNSQNPWSIVNTAKREFHADGRYGENTNLGNHFMLYCSRLIKMDVISEHWFSPLFSLGGKKMHYNVPNVYFYSLPNSLYQRINHLPYLSLAHQLYSITSNCENKHGFRIKSYTQRYILNYIFIKKKKLNLHEKES